MRKTSSRTPAAPALIASCQKLLAALEGRSGHEKADLSLILTKAVRAGMTDGNACRAILSEQREAIFRNCKALDDAKEVVLDGEQLSIAIAQEFGREWEVDAWAS